MTSRNGVLGTALTMVIAGAVWAFLVARTQAASPDESTWDAKKAASYLDSRLAWWLEWPNAARDHDTTCVSCHSVAPYALARPALHARNGEREPAAPERTMLARVVKRVTMWRDVEPFYPDQLRGLPKTSESRGTESVLNAVVLATRDASAGAITDETRQALANMWALQFKAGDLKGAWAWLNFHLEPWEADDSAYYGASLAALAVGTAPGYANDAGVRDQVQALREFVQRRIEKERLFNRVTALWASTRLTGLLTAIQRDAVVEAAVGAQREDGGWSTASLAPWKRIDGTTLDGASDAYGTAIVTVALQRVDSPRAAAAAERGAAWLRQRQDRTTGGWSAASINKQRDPASDAAHFMSDAATAYASLALVVAEGGPAHATR